MPSLRRVGKHWHIRFRDKTQTPPEVIVSLDVDDYTERQARQYMNDRDADRRAGRWSPWAPSALAETPLTVSEAVARYVKLKAAAGRRRERGGWSTSTEKSAKTWYERFATQVGAGRPVATLTRADLDLVIHAAGLSDATQRKHRRLVTAFVRWGKAAGLCDVEVPPARVTVRRLPDYLTEDELGSVVAEHRKLDAAIRERKHAPKKTNRDWMADAFTFAFYQGVRIGELLALRVSAVDLTAGTLRIGDASFVTKTREEAAIPIVPQVAEMLALRCEGQPPSARVFGHSDPYRLSRAFKEAAKVAVPHKPKVHFHSLRHSCAVFWRRKGVALEDIRDLLRHASITTTEIYEQMAPMDLRDRFSAAAGKSRENGVKRKRPLKSAAQ